MIFIILSLLVPEDSPLSVSTGVSVSITHFTIGTIFDWSSSWDGSKAVVGTRVGTIVGTIGTGARALVALTSLVIVVGLPRLGKTVAEREWGTAHSTTALPLPQDYACGFGGLWAGLGCGLRLFSN